MVKGLKGKRRLIALSATVVGSCLVRLAGAATGVMLGVLLADLHRRGVAESSAIAASLVVIAFNVSELVGAPFAGLLIDRWGLRPLLLGGPLLGIIAEVILALPPHLSFMTASRFVQGLTTACTVPAALAFLSDASVQLDERGRVMGLFEVGSIGGIALGFVAGGFFWEHFHRTGFLQIMVIYAAAISLFLLVHDRGKRLAKHPHFHWSAVRHALDLMPSWLALNAAAGIWFSQAAYQLSGAHPRPDQLLTIGLSPRTIGMIFGVYVLLFAVGTLGWGWFVGRIPLGVAMRVGTIGVILAAISILGINHAGHFRGLAFRLPLILGLIALIAETAFTPAALTLLASRSDAVPEGRGAVMGTYSMLLGGGQLIGAALGGICAFLWGIDGLIGATAVLGLIGLLTLPPDSHVGNPNVAFSSWQAS